MTANEIKKIIQKNQKDIAFVIGNGINRFPNNPNTLSWDDLLIELWDKVSLQTLSKRPNGISLTEFYDILELEKTDNTNLQKEVSTLLSNWSPMEHHHLIIEKIRALNAPILTTNFEETMSKTFDFKLFRTENEGFTDYYPWTTYHGEKQHHLPTDGFGIWFINGMINYHRSIRLGITHYMGSVERARTLIHKGKDSSLFATKNPKNWQGEKTWLHIAFHKSLFIFGLGLEENETFLRWLLIERMRYFKQNAGLKQKNKGWYVTKRSQNDTEQGKKFFLERVGFEVIEVDNYEDIYQNIWQ